MIYNLANEFERQNFKNKVNSLYEQKAVVEIKKKPVNRSLKQNSYLHVVIGLFAIHYGISIEEAKVDFFKREVNRAIFEETNEQGRIRLRSTESLDAAELTLAIERFRNWCAANADLYIPDANEHKALIYAQQLIEKNKEYL